MTRPTVLDMDLVVVPREATDEMMDRCCAAWVYLYPSFPGEKPQPTAGNVASTIYSTALSASPYPTAWDDVRKYVEELERERDEATGTLCYCEKQWIDERGVMIDKFVYERNRAEAAEGRAEAAERQLSEIAGHMDSECDSDSILHVVREAEADRDIYKDRAEAAEARIAELEKRLADAEKIVARVPPYLTDMYKAICRGDETAAAGFAGKDELVRAARAYLEGK